MGSARSTAAGYHVRGVNIVTASTHHITHTTHTTRTARICLMCNYNNQMSVTFLPTMFPTSDEKNDARIFSHRVRETLACALDVPMVEYAQVR